MANLSTNPHTIDALARLDAAETEMISVPRRLLVAARIDLAIAHGIADEHGDDYADNLAVTRDRLARFVPPPLWRAVSRSAHSGTVPGKSRP